MRIPSNKIADVVRFFRDELKNTYEKDELETLIAYCFEEYLNLKRADIFLNFDVTISESELLKFNFAVKDLKQHKPIQYIFGKADFYGLKFIVNNHVLIPRPETEELVQLIIDKIGGGRTESGVGGQLQPPNSALRSPISILDIGTGSGCIPVALKNNIPLAQVYALDISGEALEIAKQNAEMNNVDVEFFQHNILSATCQLKVPDLKFDIIVSNPPYICVSEKEQMQNNVLDHEPHLALFVNDNYPLLFYRAIADFALKNLKQNGELYFEINQALGPETKLLLENKGFKNVVLVKDINNNNRILYCSI